MAVALQQDRVPLQVASGVRVLRAATGPSERILREVANAVQRLRGIQMGAGSSVDEPEETPWVGELHRIGAADPTKDPKHLHILAPLEHRHRHQEPEERAVITASKLRAI